MIIRPIVRSKSIHYKKAHYPCQAIFDLETARVVGIRWL